MTTEVIVENSNQVYYPPHQLRTELGGPLLQFPLGNGFRLVVCEDTGLSFGRGSFCFVAYYQEVPPGQKKTAERAIYFQNREITVDELREKGYPIPANTGIQRIVHVNGFNQFPKKS